MLSTIANTIADHFYEILLIAALIIIIAILSRTITRWSETKNSVRLAEISIQRDKLGMLRQQTMIRELADASVVLKDEEKERLDAVREDIAVLSRKNLALMNEIEAKTTRLERGADLAKLQSQTQKIYEQEKKLFGLKEDN